MITFGKYSTKTDNQPPQYVGRGAKLRQSIASEGCEVYGEVHSSVLGPDVLIKKGAVVKQINTYGKCCYRRRCCC